MISIIYIKSVKSTWIYPNRSVPIILELNTQYFVISCT
jgi:hypothetical protein